MSVNQRIPIIHNEGGPIDFSALPFMPPLQEGSLIDSEVIVGDYPKPPVFDPVEEDSVPSFPPMMNEQRSVPPLPQMMGSPEERPALPPFSLNQGINCLPLSFIDSNETIPLAPSFMHDSFAEGEVDPPPSTSIQEVRDEATALPLQTQETAAEPTSPSQAITENSQEQRKGCCIIMYCVC